MDARLDRDALVAATAPLEVAVGLPGHAYTDPTVFAIEREAVFARSWVAVARHDQVAAPGDYVTCMIGTDPIVVVRDRDGALRAYPNVCRHRNMTIVEGAGNVPSLQCPYHRWTWSLDGRLLTAPEMDRSSALDKDAACLPDLRVEEWQGWVLVCVDPSSEPFASGIPGLTELCAPWDLASLVVGRSVVYDSPFNWKVLVENFSESYHHQGVHPDTLQPVFPGQRSWVEHNAGEPWLWLDHESVDPSIDTFCAAVAFPFLAFSIVRGVGALWFRIEPRAVDHTILEIVALVPPDAPDDLAEFLMRTAIEVNDEDVPVNVRTQTGLGSRFAVQGPVSHLEAGLWQFRRWWVDRVLA